MTVINEFTLRTGEEPTASALRISEELVESRVESIPAGRKPSQKQVHDIRTAIKRMRAMLLALKSALDASFFRRETGRLKSAAERLAGDRDRTVALKTLRRVAQPDRPEKERAALEAVRHWIEGARPLSHGKPLDEIRLEVEHGLRGYVASPGWVDGFTVGWGQLWTGVCLTHRQGQKRRKKAEKSGKSHDYHRWRIRVKALYYQLQWLEPVWPGKLKKLVRGFKKLEKRMGRLHDLAVLRQMIADDRRAKRGMHVAEYAIACLEQEEWRRRRSVERRAKKLYKKLDGAFWRKLRERGVEYCKLECAEVSEIAR